ncbi:hypothetical protein [Streptomyces paludis]|uniref:Streptomyces killer toxin-like beta/gamma crystallin domain-containing protein n=1 Tax=Streptomyces paludis TaxID=2282738 RepID=A0A345HU77_9ACTN|nr:hypothetical protein [Streptomyces paludis]AXG80251.1 hypothetical protein DVK44_24225 [Streptomyces paludis]
MSRKFTKVVMTAAMAATLAVGLPAAQASAIDRLGCGNRTDLLRLVYGLEGKTNTCFANAGKISTPGILYLKNISSGNNAGFAEVVSNSRWNYNFSKWHSASVDIYAVNSVTIY